MQRIKEEFLDKLESVVPLMGLSVLEVGCGDGTRTEAMARRCREVTGVEPDAENVRKAWQRGIKNAAFQVGSAESLPFVNQAFDVVVFTLSLHHVPVSSMARALDEAARVVKKTGRVVFLEPTMEGSFFEAEIEFDACDGDERVQKRAAYEAMMSHGALRLVTEMDDETVFRFDSLDDFVTSMTPKKNQNGLSSFLEANDFILRAGRRISVFCVVF